METAVLSEYVSMTNMREGARMRISAGAAKGRTVGVRKVFSRENERDELRPTSAKVREAVCDIMQSKLPGSCFLDLYAGTGAVGIEALSRGAKEVVFVEANDLRARVISHLVSEFNFAAESTIVKEKAYDFIQRNRAKGARYDIIFLDPPYFSEELMKVLPLVGEGDILREGGTVIAERFHKTVLPDRIMRLQARKHYRYGDTVLSLFRLGEP